MNLDEKNTWLKGNINSSWFLCWLFIFSLIYSCTWSALGSEDVPHRPFAEWANLPAPGQLVVGLVYEESEAYHLYAQGRVHDVTFRAADGEKYGIDINQGYLALQYGLLEKWAIDLNVGAATLGWRYFDNGTVHSTVGLMDSDGPGSACLPTRCTVGIAPPTTINTSPRSGSSNSSKAGNWTSSIVTFRPLREVTLSCCRTTVFIIHARCVRTATPSTPVLVTPLPNDISASVFIPAPLLTGATPTQNFGWAARSTCLSTFHFSGTAAKLSVGHHPIFTGSSIGHDAERIFSIKEIDTQEPAICISGQVLRGIKKPHDCPAFGKQCTPEHPLGATMVSAEGACAAYYAYGRHLPAEPAALTPA
jgi:hypothetical protein